MDIPLLYIPVTDAAIDNAYTFYGLWFESPGAVKVGPYFPNLRPFRRVKTGCWHDGLDVGTEAELTLAGALSRRHGPAARRAAGQAA